MSFYASQYKYERFVARTCQLPKMHNCMNFGVKVSDVFFYLHSEYICLIQYSITWTFRLAKPTDTTNYKIKNTNGHTYHCAHIDSRLCFSVHYVCLSILIKKLRCSYYYLFFSLLNNTFKQIYIAISSPTCSYIFIVIKNSIYGNICIILGNCHFHCLCKYIIG